MKLSIIIPLFNEEVTVIKVLDKLNEIVFPAIIENVDIIVVDDFSSDNSYNIVNQYINNSKLKVNLYKHNVNKGKGSAVKTGILHSNADLFLIQDADLELSPYDIPVMIETMDKLNVQFINGSRYLPGIPRPLASFKRYYANKIFTFLTSILIDVKLTDMACGYKLIQKDLYQKLSLKENRFGFEAELIVKALKLKRNNIAEVPVNYFPRNDGEGKKLKSTDAFRILWTILKYGLFTR